jgi:UDP-N-acetylglucosamine--N-acetylmuramyl-(pentapeptide) pyrophosphoryl-undecaprenol N-acetylglucosamine transferase
VVPALAVADALRAEGADVEFVGGERAERELVPAAGYPFHELAVRGLDRKNPFKALRAVWLAFTAVFKARRLLKRVGADAVMGGGGYVAGPVGLAALTLRLPVVLTEADSHLGITNRLLARRARKLYLAFPIEGVDGEVVGRPIPDGTVGADRDAARARFGIPSDALVILVFGGSLGALRINRASVEAFKDGAPAGAHVLHASGRRDYDELRASIGAAGHYHLEPYITAFADALAAADLAVARSGGSVFELAAAGLPALLIPYPHATADHQTGNARWMADAGAAVVVPDAELDAARLEREVAALVADRERLAAMASASAGLARPDAARNIAAGVLGQQGT